MTTNEYIQELERDVKRLELREKLEDDPKKRKAIRKKKVSAMDLLNQFRNAYGSGIEYAAMDNDGQRKPFEDAKL